MFRASALLAAAALAAGCAASRGPAASSFAGAWVTPIPEYGEAVYEGVQTGAALTLRFVRYTDPRLGDFRDSPHGPRDAWYEGTVEGELFRGRYVVDWKGEDAPPCSQKRQESPAEGAVLPELIVLKVRVPRYDPKTCRVTAQAVTRHVLTRPAPRGSLAPPER